MTGKAEREISMSRKTEKISFLAGVQVGNVIYFSAWNVNGLFTYNPRTDECRFLKSFPGEENWGLHSEAVLYENAIWFIPRASERIAIVDLDGLCITYLDLPESGYRPQDCNIPPRRMVGCHKEGDKYLWLIPRAYKLFLKIDMEKRQILDIQEWGTADFANAVGIRVQDKLWISIGSTREIRIIDFTSEEHITKRMEQKDGLYMGIQNADERIYLFPQYAKDGVLILDYAMQEKETVALDDGGQWYYEYGTVTGEGDLLLVPYLGSRCIRVGVDAHSCFIKEVIELDVEESAYCSNKMVVDGQIWFLSHVTENPVICYDEQRGVFSYRHIEMECEKYYGEILDASVQYGLEYSPLHSKREFSESRFALNLFISFVKQIECERSMEAEQRIGEEIYRVIGKESYEKAGN